MLRKLFILLFAASLHACTDGADSGNYLQSADNYESSGNYPAAIIQLKNALRDKPDDAAARFRLANIYMRIGDFPSAEKEYRQAGARGYYPDQVDPAVAKALLHQQQYREVLAEFTTKDRLSPEARIRLLVAQSEAHHGLKQVKEAGEALAKAATIDAAHPVYLLGKARDQALKRDFDTALQTVEQVLAVKSDDLEGLLLKGDILRAQNQQQDALAVYQTAIDTHGFVINAHLSLASVHLNLNEPEKAIVELDTIRKYLPNSPAVQYMQALASFKQQEYTKSRDILQDLLGALPSHMPSVLLIGATNFALQNYAQAEVDLGRYVTMYPADTYARRLLSATLLKLRQLDRAETTLKPLLQADVEELQVLLIAADIYTAKRQPKRAAEFLQKALQQQPDNVHIQTLYAYNQLAQGNQSQGLDLLRSAVAADAEGFTADYVLVMSLLGKQDYDGALTALQAFKNKQPKNPVVNNLMGFALLGKGDIGAARTSYEQALKIDPLNIAAATNLAQMDIQAGRHQDARRRYQDMLAHDDNNLPVLLALAGLVQEEGDVSQHLKLLERAAKTHPKAVQPVMQLARHFVRAGDLPKALTHANQASQLSPDNPDVLDLLASVQFTAGEGRNAVATYSKLVSLMPDAPLAHYRLGMAQSGIQDLSAAAASFRKALTLQPDYLEAQIALSAAERQAGNTKGSLAIAQQIQKSHPEAPVGYLLAGDALYAVNDFSAAADQYRRAHEQGQDGVSLIKWHQAESQLAKTTEYDDRLTRWLDTHPQDNLVRNYLAQTYLSRGDGTRAQAEYERSLAADPHDLTALNNLAWLYMDTKGERSLELAKRAYEIAGEQPAVMDTYGWTLLQRGKVSAAVELLAQATALAPRDPDVAYHHAAALAKAGRRDEAADKLGRLIATDKAFKSKAAARELLDALGEGRE